MINLDKMQYSAILKLRVCDLVLTLPRDKKDQIKQLSTLLRQHKIAWTPHIWLADEWFSPDGVAGFALPFVLGHKKLITLEKKYLGYCEGETPSEFLKLCCHETGHALDNAYKLRLSKSRQQLFGKSSTQYPNSYSPDPNSNEYVSFLKDFYAQAHPDEDWAETFAYVLTHTNWHKSYANSVALKKLNFVKHTLSQLKEKPYKQDKMKMPLHFKKDTRTVESYLLDKKRELKIDRKTFFSSHLKTHIVPFKLTSQHKKNIVTSVAIKTKINSWYIEKCLQELNQECKKKQF
ncbi:MAG: hypothetical protein HON90_07915, partial [Halobacteriovoraceae bacterium]|nr:hypothetical protein [Halobacteriovoraceae bacterium]